MAERVGRLGHELNPAVAFVLHFDNRISEVPLIDSRFRDRRYRITFCQPRPVHSIMRNLFRCAVAALAFLPFTNWSAHAAEGMTTTDGKHAIQSIEVTMVYFVPQDRVPLPDWRERLDYFARRIEKF